MFGLVRFRSSRVAVASACAAALSPLALGSIAVAGGQPAPAPSPSRAAAGRANDAETNVIGPLREIGRVRAVTPFCKSFVAHVGPAVDSAIRFEGVLEQTALDLREARLEDPLTHDRASRSLDADLHRLFDLANQGRTELKSASDAVDGLDADEDDRVVQFSDALDGAKGRQLEIVRALAEEVGRYEEKPATSIVDPHTNLRATYQDGPAGSPASSPAKAVATDAPDYFDQAALDTRDSTQRQGLFDAIAGDDLVERDLAVAADRGKTILHDANC